MSRVKWGMLVIVGAIGLTLTGVIAAQSVPGPAKAPQPINFYHSVHAGQEKIPCMYCHYTAERSEDAGLPSVQMCAGCHIPGGVPMVAKDSLGVRKLIAYWQKKEPIPWVRIHSLPSYVHFPHMMHINAGIRCQQCHGPVQEMRQVRQVASLRMGWCISCHRAKKVRTDCEVCHH